VPPQDHVDRVVGDALKAVLRDAEARAQIVNGLVRDVIASIL
jgi:hypothetical protein